MDLARDRVTLQEVVAVSEGEEIKRNQVSLHTRLWYPLPGIVGDRIGVEQVLLNLFMNALDAMSDISEGARELTIMTESLARGRF